MTTPSEAPGDEPRPFELNAHDVTRVWNLAIAIYDGGDEDADLRDYFVQALKIYFEFMEDLAKGGTEFEREEDGTRFASSREWRPEGDIVRFHAVEPEPEEPKAKKNGGKKKKKK